MRNKCPEIVKVQVENSYRGSSTTWDTQDSVEDHMTEDGLQIKM